MRARRRGSGPAATHRNDKAMRRTNFRDAAVITVLTLGGFGPVACDKGEDEAKDEGKKDAKADDGGKEAADGGEAKEGETKEGEAKAEVSNKDAEIAALKAELEAANEKLEAANEIDPEAAKQLDETITAEDEVAHEGKVAEGDKGPVSVAKATFTEKPMFGDRGSMYEVAADVTVNEVKDGGVYAKASCVMGDEVYVNVTTLSSKFGDLGKMKEGETKNLTSYLFSMGVHETPTRCQLSFDYGASTFSTRVADFCWDGSTVTDGTCAEPVTAEKKGTGKVVPFDFAFKTHPAMDRSRPDATAVDLQYGARFNEHIEQAPHLHTKTACKVGEKTWVEVSPDFPHVKPFSMEPGEATRVHHNQFFLNALPGAPEACNIEVMLDGGWGKPDEKLAEVCAKAGSVDEGRCDFRTDPEGTPKPMAPESMSIDELAVAWAKDWRDETKVVLNVRFAATVLEQISDQVQLTGKVECSAKQDKEHHVGPDLEYVGPGETVGVRMSAFMDAPLDKTDGRCELTFGAKPFLGAGGVEITKFCLKGNKLAAGKCKGKGKGKAPAVDEEVVFVPKGAKKK
jgi:hypothetical protein